MHTVRGSRARRASVVGAGLVATAGMALAGVSLADTQFDDGDLNGAAGPNLFYGANKNDCATRGTAVPGSVRLSYTGGANSPHYTAGAPVTLQITPSAAATAAGIVVAQTGSTSIPSPWTKDTSDVSVPFTTTVPAGTPDGNYKVEVVAATGAYTDSGKHTFQIHVNCTGPAPANVAPTVDAISGAAAAPEGSDGTYSVAATDDDGDTLTYAWSVLSGDALIPDDPTQSSVGVHFTDGPSTVVLQVVVDDGNGHTVTRTISIDETNVAPTTTLDGPAAANEGDTKSYTYSVADPGNDTSTTATSCGANGTTSNELAGSFDCTFPNGTATSGVSATSTDSDGDAGNTATITVSIANVTPVLSNLVLGGATGTACLGGTPVTATYAFSDPGADSPWTPSVNWGDAGTTDVLYPTVATPGAVGPLSHTYMGAGTWTVTAKVSDGEATGTLASAAGAVTLLYSSGQGILQPINYTGPRSAFKLGSTIPVKLRITDCKGTAVSTLKPQVLVKKIDNTVDPGAQDEAAVSTVPDQGNLMRYSDLQYIFNLATKSLTVGTYQITVTDPSIAPVTALIDVKK